MSGAKRMKIHCCACGREISARLTGGREVYPYRPDLKTLPFWRCDTCGNFVGCHHKTPNPTRPLGCIPTPELKEVRKQIHALIDPIWKNGQMSRGKLYAKLGDALGRHYHTGELRSMDEAETVLRAAREIVGKA